MKAIHIMDETLITEGRISWERLVELGLVDRDTIDGTQDAKWLVGDDVLDKSSHDVRARTGKYTITTDYGLELSDSRY